MTEHKTDMNITKTDKYKKNEQQQHRTEHRTDMNIARCDTNYDRTQNRHENY